MKPFLSGRTQVKNANLQPLVGLSAVEAVARAASAHKHTKDGAGGPSVETVKQGDKIVRLIVTCSCGERIEIDCLYPAGG
ncbi:MAG: hypothetical protein QM790_14735 [Nibricoccus sp.]